MTRKGSFARGNRRRDEGNLLVLAGIVLAVAVVTTSLALTQVNMATESAPVARTSSFTDEWSFIRERTHEVFRNSITLASNEPMVLEAFEATVAEVKVLQKARGYNIVIRPAAEDLPLNELSFVNADNRYDDLVTQEGIVLSGSYDGVNDGFVWTDGGAGYLQAVIVYFYFANEYTNVTEIGVFSVNTYSGVPSAPTVLKGSGHESSATITWKAPLDPGGGPVLRYHVWRESADAPGTAAIVATVPSGTYSFEDPDLVSGGEFFFNVTAENAFGMGESPEPIAVLTGTAPGVVNDLAASPGNGYVNVTWTPGDAGAQPVTHWNIYRGASPNNLFLVGQRSSGAPPHYYNDSHVTNGETYHYAVSAVSSIGEGPLSLPISRTPKGPPGAVVNLAAAPGSQFVALDWDVPVTDGGSAIWGYFLEMASTPGGPPIAMDTTFETEYVWEGLSNGDSRHFSVWAVNEEGHGPKTVVISTPGERPSPVPSLDAIPLSQAVFLEWETPETPSGTLTYHVLNVTPGGNGEVVQSLSSTWTVVQGLANGYAYTFAVVAENIFGTSDPSPPVTVTPRTTPGAPRNLTATPAYSSPTSSIHLSWEPPENDGGSAITGYVLYVDAINPPVVALPEFGPETFSYTHTPLVQGVTYYYRVAAVNDAGEGTKTATVAKKAGTSPTMPLLLLATPGNNSVGLTWDAPLQNGGYPVTSYNVYRGTSPGSLSLLTNVTGALSHTDASASNGVTYYYAVAAVNILGESEKSLPATAKPADVPTAPLNLQATALTLQVRLNWQAPASDGGSPVTNYVIYAGITPNPITPLATVSADTTTFTHAGLTAGVNWYYRVKAMNEMGLGPYSNEVMKAANLL